MITTLSLDNMIDCACEVFATEGDFEATAIVNRMTLAAERRASGGIQDYDVMEMLLRVHAIVWNRRMSAERVAEIVRQMV